MDPCLSPSSACRRRLDRNPPGGFTLVELLVVITIIAMLVGLLIPAVMRAREAARRATCLNNQGQIGKAIMNYVTAKEKYPPLFSVMPQPATGDLPMLTPAPAVGWVPPMLPYLEQNPLYQVFQANTWKNAKVLNAEVATLMCPSRNPTNSPAPLSYIVNAGVSDYIANPIPTYMKPQLDFQDNGIFFDDYGWRLDSTIAKPPRIDLAYINMYDGTSMTLLISENIDAHDWINLPLTPSPIPLLQPVYNQLQYVASWWQTMTWTVGQVVGTTPPFAGSLPDWGTSGFPTGQILNRQPTAIPSQDVDKDFLLGRPSSNHPGGFIVTMCDARSQFMSEDVEYRVYCMLMSPNGQGVKNPKFGTPVVYPDSWAPPPTRMLTPITEADLNP
jgi:prepilin-type N-terminal cleavage/methylation domain-containing protein